MAVVAFGSFDLGMGGKFERYVSHILASTSSRKAAGQPLSSPCSWCSTFSKLSSSEGLVRFFRSSLPVDTAESTWEADESEAPGEWAGFGLIVDSEVAGRVGCESYCWPRHQMVDWSLLLGIGS